MLFQRVAINDVDSALEQAGYVFLECHIGVNRALPPGLEFDEDIDIAVRSVVTARHRTEHGRTPNTARPQSGLGFS